MGKINLKRLISTGLTSVMALGLLNSFSAYSVRVVNAEDSGSEETWSEVGSVIVNGDFEEDLGTGWSYSIDWNSFDGSWTKESGMTNNTTNVFHYYNGGAETGTITLSQTLSSLEAGTYRISLDAEGEADYTLKIGDTETDSISYSSEWDVWDKVYSDPYILSDGGQIDIQINLAVNAGGWGDIDNVTLYRLDENESGESTDEFKEKEGYEWVDSNIVQNGGFEDGVTSWSINNESMAPDSDTTNSGSYALKTKWSQSDAVETLVTQTVKLSSGWYYLSFAQEGDAAASGLSVSIGDISVECPATTDWNNWVTINSDYFYVAEETEYTIAISGSVPAGYWGSIDDIALYRYEESQAVVRTFDFDTTPVSGAALKSGIAAEKVDGLTNGFITGADISSYRSIRNSGATYKDADGKVLDDAGFFNLLKESGVNYVRIRVWVNPYDSKGNGYGGGNNDLKVAKDLGKLATDAGLGVLIDFHYSDFWTDPGKQMVPKSWSDYTLEEKASALKKWTEDSLQELLDAEVNVGMVQIGNETTTGFCGEKVMANVCTLFRAGSEAVQKIEADNNTKIMIAIHLTNPDSINFSDYAKQLKDNKVVYDVFATSYYPYWHGTLENLYQKLAAVSETYGKYVMVAETSYVRTLEDGDGHPNTVREGKNDEDLPYDVSEQGQVNHVRNVIKTVAGIPDNKGIGVFWWEPAWIPVNNYNDADNKEEVLEQNKALWEKYGSGWASSYSSEYDADDAGKWYGGTAVDNESWFDFNGQALESINVYNLIRYGSTKENSIKEISDASVVFEEDDEIQLPATVSVRYINGDIDEVPVTWNDKEAEEAKGSGIGEYTVNGKAVYNEKEYDVKCILKITATNLLKTLNNGFEDGTDKWTLGGTAASVNGSDVHSGNNGWHFWDDSDFTCSVEQTITLEPGTYVLGTFIQGGDCGDAQDIYLYAAVNEDVTKAETVLTGWNEWKNPEITNLVISENTDVTIGIKVTAAAGGWGTADDFYLYKLSDEDLEKAAELTALIDSLGDVTLESEELISKAREAYNELSDLAKKGITNLDTLDNAEKKLAELKKEAEEQKNQDKTEPDTKDDSNKQDSDTQTDSKDNASADKGEVKDNTTENTVTQAPASVDSSDKKPAKVGKTIIDSKTKYKYIVTSSNVKNPEVKFAGAGNKNIKSVKVPATVKIDGVKYKVTAITKNAFKNYIKLKSVTIGANVKAIGTSAFQGCTSLKKITIPAKVTTIHKKAFYGCKNLKKITIKSKKLKTVKSNAIKGINKKAVIKVPKKKLSQYKKLFTTKKGFKKTMKIKKALF